MNNAELIAALRCEYYGDDECDKSDCPIWSELGCRNGIANRAAADALEAADKRIVELNTKCADLQSHINSMESEIEELLPKEGEWIEDTYSPGHNLYTCSACGLAMITTPDYAEKHHYCYDCGAKNKVKWMKGEQE